MSGESSQVYRCCLIGLSLEQTLNRLIEEKELTLELKEQFMAVFDETLGEEIKLTAKNQCTMTGELEQYQNVTNIWKFWVSHAQIRSHTETLYSKMLKIMAIQKPVNIEEPIKRHKKQ